MNSKVQFQSLLPKHNEGDIHPEIQQFNDKPTENSKKPSNLYNQAVQEMHNNKQQNYIDQQFLFEQAILKDDKQFHVDNVIWKRPCEIFQGKIELFGVISPADVLQGKIGNAYLLSSLSSMASDPENIKKLFLNNSYETNGLYCIYICDIEIIIDDYFPCTNNKLAFTQSFENKIWVMLLEKAYAKYYGSYNAIVAGRPVQAMRDFMLCYTSTIKCERYKCKLDELWKELINNNTQKQLQVATTDQEQKQQQGIIPGHCYSILDIQEIRSINDTVRLILLRNPWGRQSGFYCDQSKQWSSQIKKNIAQNLVEENGAFWMTLQDFLNEFTQIDIGHLKQNYYRKLLLLEFDSEKQVALSLVEMKVKQQTNAILTISQLNKREFEKYSLIRIVVGKLHSNTKEIMDYRGSEFDVDRDVSVQGDFEEGEYAIYVEVDWVQNENRSLKLSYSGDKDDTELSQFSIKAQQLSLYANNIFDGLIRAHAKTLEGTAIKDYSQGIRQTSGQLSGYQYFWFYNKTNNTTLQLRIFLQSSQYIEVCSPFEQQNPIIIICRPLSSCMVKLRVTKDGKGGYQYSHQIQSKLSEARSEQDIIKLALLRPDERSTSGVSNNIQAIVYKINFQDGFAFVYENNENQIYSEVLSIKGNNLEGINVDISKEIHIEVLPGQYKVIQLRIKDLFEGWSFSMSKSYALK